MPAETRRQLAFRIARLSVLAAALLWSLSVACLYHGQKIMTYHPLSEHRSDPAEHGLAYEDVAIHTRDGETLSAWFVPAEPARSRGVVLYCHGSGANIGYRVRIVELLHRLDVDILMFDYRGFGQSTGDPDEMGTYLDVDGAWRYLTTERGIDPSDIVVYGRSLGGPISAWLATREQPAGLVIDSSFTSLPDYIDDNYPSFLIVPSLIEYGYETRRYIADVDAPVLIAHSRDDTMIPFGHADALFAAAPAPKSLLELRGGHSEAPFESGEIYVDGLRRFLDSVLPAHS